MLWGSAQVAEATRGAVESIPHEQHEAAGSARVRLGRPPRSSWCCRRRRAGCSRRSSGLLVNVIQNTTLAQVIGVAEMLETGER